jgi:hypothetical protein
MTMPPNQSPEPEDAMLGSIFSQHPLELRFSRSNLISPSIHVRHSNEPDRLYWGQLHELVIACYFY